MKKIVLVYVLFLFANHSFSQTNFGLKVGTNLVNINSGASSSPFEPQGLIGITTKFKLYDVFSLNAELHYNHKGDFYDGSNKYISLPLLFGCDVHKNFMVYAGPEISLLVKPTYARKSFKTFDFAIDAGFYYQSNRRINADIRVSNGIMNIYTLIQTSNHGRFVNKVIQLTIGFLLIKKK